MQDYWRFQQWSIQAIAAQAVRCNPQKWPVSANTGQRKRKQEDSEVAMETGPESKKGKHNTIESGGEKVEKIEDQLPGRNLPPKSDSELYNPYEGQETALQLNEPVDSFLRRLKPSSADPRLGPWIYCANFYAETRPSESDVAGFKQEGHRLLERMLAKREALASQFDPPKSEGAITRMLADDKAALESEILSAARKHGVMHGKWMLFPPVEKVDRYWAAVVRATVERRLGTAAKVATKPEGDGKRASTQVICVYTPNVSDAKEVKRVLLELVRLKLVPDTGVGDRGLKAGDARRQIWYKPECYSYLDIVGGNEYKIKPTLYGSGSLLTSADLRGLA